MRGARRRLFWMDPREVGRVFRVLSAIDVADEDDWEHPPAQERSVSVVIKVPTPRTAVFLTKCPFQPAAQTLVRPLGRSAIMWRWGVPLPEHMHVVASVVRGLGLRQVGFLGDLDPLDLLAFVATRTYLKSHRISAKYLGVDSSMLKNVAPHWRIKMSSNDHRRWTLLLRSVPECAAWIGPEAVELLHSGYKLELEGAVNPSGREPKFAKSLSGLIRDRLGRLGPFRDRT